MSVSIRTRLGDPKGVMGLGSSFGGMSDLNAYPRSFSTFSARSMEPSIPAMKGRRFDPDADDGARLLEFSARAARFDELGGR
jgi:hypothetical protein